MALRFRDHFSDPLPLVHHRPFHNLHHPPSTLALPMRKQLRTMRAKVHVDIHLLKDAP